MSEAWKKRRDRYGPTGARNPDEYRERARRAHAGKKPLALSFKGHKHSDETKRKIIKNLWWQKTRKNPLKDHKLGDTCWCGAFHGQPGMLGKHHSLESRRRNSEANKLAHNMPERLEKKRRDAQRQWRRPDVRAKIAEGQRLHDQQALEDLRSLHERGYDVLALGRVFMPDGLARKDGKIYPVETDFDGNTPSEKYEGLNFFDGPPIWFKHEHPHYVAVCRNTECPRHGKPFEYKIPTEPKPKFCSRACYWASLKGKAIRWQDRMHLRGGRVSV